MIATLTRSKPQVTHRNSRPWVYAVTVDGRTIDRQESGHTINLLETAIGIAKANGATRIVKAFGEI